MTGPLSPSELHAIDAYWRAANYLSVGQIYLYDNPLLREPLRREHVKPRLLGHFGTTPGLNLVWAHLNRAIIARDLDVVYVAGPGHGGPGLVANAYLEGTYTEVYPEVSRDEAGLKRLFTQFSFPGGIPSHLRLKHEHLRHRTRDAVREITEPLESPIVTTTALKHSIDMPTSRAAKA
jgi:xylulose-5-phosphate/fructose-6-phosphate phosphoketolase